MAVVVRIYNTYEASQSAVEKLEKAGISDVDISIVANAADQHQFSADGPEGDGPSGGIGEKITKGATLLAGVGMLAIPGIGPAVAAGWLATVELGRGAGVTTGDIVGELARAGVSEQAAHLFGESIRRGGTLLAVHVPATEIDRIEALLSDGYVDVAQRAAEYRSGGWQQFDYTGTGMTADEIRQEREKYLSGG